MAATIKDVARLAGVSPSTVSRVLNQKGVISDETKQKIASAMEQLKYVPNDIARSFANGSAHAISLVIDISDGTAYANNFFNNTVFGIETAAHQNDYNLIITNGAAAFGGISSVVGAGGGFISVPFMVWCNTPMHKAVGTSAALGFPIALAGTLSYIVAGWKVPELTAVPHMLGYIHWPALLSVAAASVLTAPLGARTAHRMDTKPLKRAFACLLLILAGCMLYRAVLSL